MLSSVLLFHALLAVACADVSYNFTAGDTNGFTTCSEYPDSVWEFRTASELGSGAPGLAYVSQSNPVSCLVLPGKVQVIPGTRLVLHGCFTYTQSQENFTVYVDQWAALTGTGDTYPGNTPVPFCFSHEFYIHRNSLEQEGSNAGLREISIWASSPERKFGIRHVVILGEGTSTTQSTSTDSLDSTTEVTTTPATEVTTTPAESLEQCRARVAQERAARRAELLQLIYP